MSAGRTPAIGRWRIAAASVVPIMILGCSLGAVPATDPFAGLLSTDGGTAQANLAVPGPSAQVTPIPHTTATPGITPTPAGSGATAAPGITPTPAGGGATATPGITPTPASTPRPTPTPVPTASPQGQASLAVGSTLPDTQSPLQQLLSHQP